MTLAELNIGAVLPEILVSSMACFILLVELVTKPHKSCALAWPLTALSLLGASYLSLEQLADPLGSALNGLVIQDGVSAVLRATTCLAAVVVLFYSRAYSQERGLWRVEYLVLALFGVVGMMTMIGSAHLLTLYVGIELLALCLYGMIAMQRDSVAAAEAAMKYFILGALASGLLLYGMSLLYGLTGSLSLDQISDSTLTRLDPSSLPLTLAVVMVIAGL
ncbi:MAG: proton-conducting transporter membrane subunit, partial [Arenicellales bacterium]|nr:proton-conducting transporter membrane subunit [Arenicellales bacterium]